MFPNLQGDQKKFRADLIASFRENILKELLQLFLIFQIFHKNLRFFQTYCPIEALQVTHELRWGIYEDAFFGED